MWKTTWVKARQLSDGRDAVSASSFLLLRTQRRFIHFAPKKSKEIICLMHALSAGFSTAARKVNSATSKRAGNSLTA
ncbi:hypothetical protein CG434_09750 [Pantoea ananatis]|jgi:hypothetical protein|nr:hypothetical protein AW734_20785 [Pantoea ananatis]PQK76622.1 hypothetical protein CG427_07740 [Pantoea ananatis]PQK77281.1 hypothetical protein CG428_09485 [Pantoea ananatis]PQL01771.1 hypothetical protein CG434_09750 [Pantoea ananatis]